ncbi:uncharacterized protein [Rutidosis leptorrhynchoides]|uniref:uncharacterized protein n=1 Tax=Rutidosis leptorrhynchoides TaxID=125765 RepID=UPI003A992A25
MEPLVDELKVLWDNGVETYDSSTNGNFQMRAGLVWTISDFTAYSNLSGWRTKGKLACPSCHTRTRLIWLRRNRKFVFMVHRRWMSKRHAYRKDKYSFDGTKELEMKPTCLTGSDVLNELHGLEFKFGKEVKDNPVLPYNWKKTSIFFQLPYWKNNVIRHNLDVMHIEKNMLKGVKVPNGYSANISRCAQLKPLKIGGLKSHDNHILMQQLLPLCIRSVVPKHVRSVVIRLCRYYRRLCCKVLDPTKLLQMENDIGKILCDLERIFPPSFFDIMVHLSVHLAYEASIGGPVQYRWMYPIERYLATLKSYVRNRSKPEGSISEGYLADRQLFTHCREHPSILRRENKKEHQHLIQRMHNNNFETWFWKHVRKLYNQGVDEISEDRRHLANGPSEYVTTYKGYIVNGYRF